MKSIKRTLAIILSLCLLAGVVPFGGITAAADDKITLTTAGASINKEYLPKVGDPVVSSPDFISVSKGDVYEKSTERGTWYSDELTGTASERVSVSHKNITHHEEEIGYCFEAGRTYYYSFDLKIKSQYRTSHTFAANKGKVTFTARNLAAGEYQVYYTWGRGDTLEVVLKFTVSGSREYNDIENVYAYKYTSSYGYVMVTSSVASAGSVCGSIRKAFSSVITGCGTTTTSVPSSFVLVSVTFWLSSAEKSE